MSVSFITPDGSGICCGCRDGCVECGCDIYTGALDYVTSMFGSAGCMKIDGGLGSVNMLDTSDFNRAETMGYTGSQSWGDPAGGTGYEFDGISAGYCNATCAGETSFVGNPIQYKLTATCQDNTHLTVTLTVTYFWNDGSGGAHPTPSCLTGDSSDADVFTATINWPTATAPGMGTFSAVSGPGLITPGVISVTLP